MKVLHLLLIKEIIHIIKFNKIGRKNMNIESLIFNIMENIVIKALLLFLILDTFLGSIRAWKEHKWNSTVGINGMLRKIAMIGCIFFLSIFDKILNLNFLFMVPEKVMEFIKDMIILDFIKMDRHIQFRLK